MSLAAQITPTGMSIPSYEDILASLIASYQGIYGADIYLGNDSQDFQTIAIFAAAMNDANQMALASYNAFSPSTAQGAGLSSVVKINGLGRLVSSQSTVNLTIVGQAGKTITNGIAGDLVGNQWLLPSSVTIPIGGSIIVTATAAKSGNITAPTNTVQKIVTPTLGWQSVNNATAAVPGAPVEVDATLRGRQAVSTALPALSVLDSIVGAVANIAGVQRYAAYENSTSATDGNGLPGHSVSMVVEGGDAPTIASTIAGKKTPGTGTYGNTSIQVIDSAGIPATINFNVLIDVTITVEIDITALPGYVSSTGAAIAAAVAADIDARPIGGSVYYRKLYTPANLGGGAIGETFNITAIKIARTGSPAAADVAIAYNEGAICAVSNVTLVVT